MTNENEIINRFQEISLDPDFKTIWLDPGIMLAMNGTQTEIIYRRGSTFNIFNKWKSVEIMSTSLDDLEWVKKKILDSRGKSYKIIKGKGVFSYHVEFAIGKALSSIEMRLGAPARIAKQIEDINRKKSIANDATRSANINTIEDPIIVNKTSSVEPVLKLLNEYQKQAGKEDVVNKSDQITKDSNVVENRNIDFHFSTVKENELQSDSENLILNDSHINFNESINQIESIQSPAQQEFDIDKIILCISSDGFIYNFNMYEYMGFCNIIPNSVNIVERLVLTKSSILVNSNPLQYLVIVTRNSNVIKVPIRDVIEIDKLAKKIIDLNREDLVVGAIITNGSSDIYLTSCLGRVIRFTEVKINVTKIATKGRTAMELDLNNDWIISIQAAKRNTDMLTLIVVSEFGIAKRISLEDIRVTYLNASGNKVFNTDLYSGNLSAAFIANNKEIFMLSTIEGIIKSLKTDDLQVVGRAVKGSRLIEIKGKDRIYKAVKIKI